MTISVIENTQAALSAITQPLPQLNFAELAKMDLATLRKHLKNVTQIKPADLVQMSAEQLSDAHSATLDMLDELGWETLFSSDSRLADLVLDLDASTFDLKVTQALTKMAGPDSPQWSTEIEWQIWAQRDGMVDSVDIFGDLEYEMEWVAVMKQHRPEQLAEYVSSAGGNWFPADLPAEVIETHQRAEKFVQLAGPESYTWTTQEQWLDWMVDNGIYPSWEDHEFASNLASRMTVGYRPGDTIADVIAKTHDRMDAYRTMVFSPREQQLFVADEVEVALTARLADISTQMWVNDL